MANLRILLSSPTEIFSRLFTTRGSCSTRVQDFQISHSAKEGGSVEETNQFPFLCLDLILWSSPNQPLLGEKGSPIISQTYTTSDFVYFQLSLGSGSWIPLSYCG